ncbi:MAG: tRNA (N(6)-L-threonylcarbamoyladenosine(37)-C(2))-methylthiotransferase MtaB [Candidatus Omnitrophica bacterium]|nr:tRNA (N(6)-L-threonylcarbamoyladenosine(37)-C(2))-methylthiotransferase MtaB [Candidatus Omnitrophota bacterium]
MYNFSGILLTMKKNISFYTLGCRSNQAETAVLRNLFEQSGYQIIPEDKPSDIAVVNTCTVTEKGDRDTRKIISALKRRNPKVKIALIGCQAQTQSEDLKLLANVHWIVGNADKMNLVSLIEAIKLGQGPYIHVPVIPKRKFTMPTAGVDKVRTRANVKIQDGCESFCAYCEVPFARGPARSRDFDDIFKEVHQLVDAGYKEIVLTGINVGAYAQGQKTITDVIKKLNEIFGLERIRISSIEPNTISDELILLMGTAMKLCRYLHVQIQSASDKVLRLMGRKYTCDTLDLFFEFATQNVADICIGADIIVGFPGESEKDFNDTYKFLVDSPLAYFHVFSYSDRKFARSRNFSGQVNRVVVQARSAILRQLSLQKKQKFLRSFLGTSQKVLFEEQKKGFWLGLTDNYIRVKVASSKKLHNKILDAHFSGIEKDIMIGTLD